MKKSEVRKYFDEEINKQKNEIAITFDCEEANKRLDQIEKKIIHTEEVVNDGLKACDNLGFNDSVKDFAYITLLNHDIGRFYQMYVTGNFNDSKLRELTGFKDHGVLGSNILIPIIGKQLPDDVLYHYPVRKVVEDHTSRVSNYKELLILQRNLLRDYSIDELLSSDKTREDTLGTLTQIVQDVDRLDIYHQILDGRWCPLKSDQDIDPKVFEMFYKGEYLNMAQLREQGLWNSNVGELVRCGFINQIKLLSVAKLIRDENIIMRLKEVRNNPRALDAFEFTNQRLNEMIENSTDGITVGKPKSLTLK